MRFAWLRQHTADYLPVKQRFADPAPLARFVYNAAFWVFLLPFFSAMDDRVGFVAFAGVIVVRFASNWYTNNALDLSPGHYDAYPFRIP
ncbi:MAG: hypothetical protein QNJ88_03815 [Acidimicrobiia bacterium]|nr:hypothetical protein [Acidimicrobiia bacterium]